MNASDLLLTSHEFRICALNAICKSSSHARVPFARFAMLPSKKVAAQLMTLTPCCLPHLLLRAWIAFYPRIFAFASAQHHHHCIDIVIAILLFTLPFRFTVIYRGPVSPEEVLEKQMEQVTPSHQKF